MDNLGKIILYSFFSGFTVFLGGFISRYVERFKNDELKQEIIHTATAFGGGILIAAVAFVLVPKGIETLSLLNLIVLFLAGTFAFYYIDKAIQKTGGTAAQIMAMMMDFVPEAIALGAVFAQNANLGLLLAIFIGLQNLPEAFNAYIDLRGNKFSPNKCMCILFPLSFVGIFAALAGSFLLSSSQSLVAGLMVFSSGGIVYLMFQDIAPMAKMKSRYAPSLAACFGFLVGMIGEKLLG